MAEIWKIECIKLFLGRDVARNLSSYRAREAVVGFPSRLKNIGCLSADATFWDHKLDNAARIPGVHSGSACRVRAHAV